MWTSPGNMYTYICIFTSQPLYGDGSGVCVYFFLCVYSFLMCWFPLGVFGAHFGFLLDPFGVPRAPKGLSLVSLWLPFGSLGAPWGDLRQLGLPSGAWDDLGWIMDVRLRQYLMRLRWLRIKSDLAEFSPLCTISAQSTQNGARAAALIQLHSRWGPGWW